MVQMMVQLPAGIAKRIQPLSFWLPAILEISFVGFKTLATATATEVIEFLSANPKPADVLNFYISERAQTRLQRLLALNQAGLLGENEQRELNELQQLEHIIVMLKARLIKQEKAF
jgi:predicted amidohydrolase